MSTKEWVGLQLRRARQPRRQEEVAVELRAIGVPMSQNRLSRLERGESEMTPNELRAFCRYFGVPPDYFLEEPEDMSLLPERVNEEAQTYNRLTGKLEELSEAELEAVERIVDELRKKS